MGRSVHLHSHPSRVEHWRHLVEIVALCGAAIWAVYVFVYQEHIKPESTPPRVQPVFAIETHALSAGRTYIKVHLDMRNTGQSTASVAAVNVNVNGVLYGSRVAVFTRLPAAGIVQSGNSLPPSPERFLSSFTNIWHAFGSSKHLDLAPGGSFDESFAFAVPDKLVDAVNLRYVICYTHPTERRWNETLVRNADGSNTFAQIDRLIDHPSDGLLCSGNRRGEPFPL